MQGIFNMASDSSLFRTSDELETDGWHMLGTAFVRSDARMLPLYEAKMIHHFDSRFSTYDGATQAQINKGTLPHMTPSQHADSLCLPIPRYWVDESEVDKRLARRSWEKNWLLGWRDICRSSDERTVISAVIPRAAVGDKFLLAFSECGSWILQANLSAFVFDYCARQKYAGTSLKYFLFKQLPVLPPDSYQAPLRWLDGDAPTYWIRQRALELTYTAYDLAPFATDLGDDGPPFRWDEERRFTMRAELDAAFFHLYGVNRDDLGYIMDSFRAFQNNDRARFDRTKGLILEVYDAMAEAIRTGEPYQTILDPPPGLGPRQG